MKKRLTSLMAIVLSVLFVLPMGVTIVGAVSAMPRATTHEVSDTFKDEARNVALYKEVTITGYDTNTSKSFDVDVEDVPANGWGPDFAVDGYKATETKHTSGLMINNTDITATHYVDIIIDLGGSYIVNGYEMTKAYADGSAAMPKKFKLLVSTNGETYTEVINVANNDPVTSTISASFAASEARYVCLRLLEDSSWNIDAASPDLGMGITTCIGELEIYGVPNTGDTWSTAPDAVQMNASPLDTRKGSLTYTTSADGESVNISYFDPTQNKTVSYTVPNNNNYLFGGYAAVGEYETGSHNYDLNDSNFESVGAISADQERYVGLFYFLWHGDWGPLFGDSIENGGIAYNMEENLVANGNYYKYDSKNAPATGNFAWFAEPLYGYYFSNDQYVLRKHAELLTNANVDFLYFDNTNAPKSYVTKAMYFMSILQEMADEGWDVPQIVFYCNANALSHIKEYYTEVYSKGLYEDVWFKLDGKPVLVAPTKTVDSASGETVDVYTAILDGTTTVEDVFTLKHTQWPNADEKSIPWGVTLNQSTTNNSWPWMDFHWPQTIYYNGTKGNEGAINVSLAQHAGNGAMSDTVTGNNSTYSKYNRGRSFVSNGYTSTRLQYSTSYSRDDFYKYADFDAYKDDKTLSYKGNNFQEQFDYAIKSDAQFILVTGWNEWIAQNGGTADSPLFVDGASYEYSRDAEMTKGLAFDSYYIQLASNIQRVKGTAPYIIQDQRYPINVTGSFAQWNNIDMTYADPSNDALGRAHTGFGEDGYKLYTNYTGRNDIVASKITSDTKNVYFYIETVNAITAYTTDDAWMQVYVNADCNASTGWNGYDYIVNYQAAGYRDGAYLTSIAKWNSGTSNWEKAADDIAYQVKGNKMMIEVPLGELGYNDHNNVNFEFKIFDGAVSSVTMETFYTDGDAAPLGRFNYVYHGRTTDNPDPASPTFGVDDAVGGGDAAEVEYVKEEKYTLLTSTSGTNTVTPTATASTSAGLRISVPANVTLTDIAAYFTGVTAGAEVTLRVYRWNSNQTTTVGGVVLYETTTTLSCAEGNNKTHTLVIDLPADGAKNAITDGDYFFVWLTTGGKLYTRKADSTANETFTTIEGYANGSTISNSSVPATAVSYVQTTTTKKTPVDSSKYTKLDPNKKHVIILAGQSNAAGNSTNNDILLHDAAHKKENTNGYENIKIWYNVDDYRTNTGEASTTTYGRDSTKGSVIKTQNDSDGVFVNVKIGQGAASGGSMSGIEIGLAQYLSETYPGETFYIIKSAIGGSSLYGRTDHIDWTTNGYAWQNFAADVPTALAALGTADDVEIVAMMWMQGESDAETLSYANAYGADFKSLMGRMDTLLSSYYAKGGMALIDAAICTNACWDYPTIVNAQKRAYAAESQNRYYLPVNGLTVGEDMAHYTALSVLSLGESVGKAMTEIIKNAGYTPKAPVVEDSAEEATNIALGKDVTVTGDGNPLNNGNWVNSNLTDGIVNGGTSGNGIFFALPTNTTSVAAIVDLGAVCNIDSIALYRAHNDGSGSMPVAYTVDVAGADGVYTTLYTVTNGDPIAGNIAFDAPEGTTGRYVRINITQGSGWDLTEFGMGFATCLGELEVYGVDPNAGVINLAGTSAINGVAGSVALGVGGNINSLVDDSAVTPSVNVTAPVYYSRSYNEGKVTYNFTKTQYKYFRITISKNGAAGGLALGEVMIYGATYSYNSTTNQATSATVSSDNNFAGYEAYWTPSGLNDGKTANTASPYGWRAIDGTNTATITFTFSKSYYFDKIELYPFAWTDGIGADTSYFPQIFVIEASNDNSTWTQIAAEGHEGSADGATGVGVAVGGPLVSTFDKFYSLNEVVVYPAGVLSNVAGSLMPAFTVEVNTGAAGKGPEGTASGWTTIGTYNPGLVYGDDPIRIPLNGIVGGQVRITPTGNSATGVNAFGKIQIFGREQAQEDVAAGAHVTVAPVGNTLNWKEGEWNNQNMTDGKTGISQGVFFWDGEHYDAAPGSNTELVVRLDSLSSVSSFELFPFQFSVSNPQGYGMPRGYTISVSTDGVTYESVVAVAKYPDDGNAEKSAYRWVLAEAVDARFVKITVDVYTQYVTTNSGIGEFNVIGTKYDASASVPADAENVTLNKAVTVVKGSTLNNASPWLDSMMVDGIIGSVGNQGGLYITNKGDYASNPTDPTEIVLSLGGLHTVYSYEMHPFQFTENVPEGCCMPTAYNIYGSVDGSNYDIVLYSAEDFSTTGSHGDVFFTSADVRYIKIKVTGYAHTFSTWTGIGEFIVMGEAKEDISNVALGKPVSSSNTANLTGSVNDGWGIQFVTDGLKAPETNTSGVLYTGLDITSRNTVDIDIDLQGTYEISSFSLVTAYSDGTAALPTGYKFMVSTNGSTYTAVKTVTGAATGGTVAHVLDSVQTGITHVRLQLTEDSGWNPLSTGIYTAIGEIEVMGRQTKSAGVSSTLPTLDSNLATGSGVLVSADSEVEGHLSSALNDGNTSSGSWQGAELALPTITVALGSVYEVSAVVLYSASSTSTLPHAFEVQVSTDGVAWTTVYTCDKLIAESAAGQAFAAQFPKVHASYVRVVVTANGDAGYSEIRELQVRGTAHSFHVYDQADTDKKFLATAATCNAQATYYYSCVCGQKGTETFSAGKYAAHNYVTSASPAEENLYAAATCTAGAVYIMTCDDCGKQGGGIYTVGDPSAHDYGENNYHEDYQVTAPTCSTHGTYYKSCSVCDQMSDEIITATKDEEFLPHTKDETGTYDKETGVRSYKCTVCETPLKTIGTELSMSLTLKSNLDVHFYADVDLEATEPELTVTPAAGSSMKGATIEGTAVEGGTEGRQRYEFTYANVGPQNVGTAITYSLACDGNTIKKSGESSPVIENYLKDLSKSEDVSEETKNVADALLNYAAAAKRYVTGDTSIKVDVTGFTNIEKTDKKLIATGGRSDMVTFEEATVWFDSSNRIRFKVKMKGTYSFNDNDTSYFTLEINDGDEVTVISKDNIRVSGDTIYIYTDEINATNFGDVYTLRYRTGSGNASTYAATYSVNSYIYSQQQKTVDDNASLLAKALSLYGEAAKAYAGQ